MTVEDYEKMVIRQRSACAICRADQPGGRGKHWHIDHDHETGRVRGLLCHICNTRLATIDFHKAAIVYLTAAVTEK
jgi:hypothetical protein